MQYVLTIIALIMLGVGFNNLTGLSTIKQTTHINQVIAMVTNVGVGALYITMSVLCLCIIWTS